MSKDFTLKDYKGMLSRFQKDFIIRAINQFGAKDHPNANMENVDYFTAPYVIEVLPKCLPHMTEKGQEIVKGIQDLLGTPPDKQAEFSGKQSIKQDTWLINYRCGDPSLGAPYAPGWYCFQFGLGCTTYRGPFVSSENAYLTLLGE